MKKFDDYLAKRLTASKITQINSEAKNEYDSLYYLQQQIAIQLEEYMAKEDIGFNELARRLDLSASQLSKLRQGKANITLATFSHVLSIMHKQPVLQFINTM